jgi:hypothetical protein
MKLCITCNLDKDLNEFEVRSDTKKHRNQCKVCRASYVNSYRRGIDSGEINKKNIVVIDGEKQCNHCKTWKLLEQFPNRPTKHGKRHECLECKKTRLQKYYTKVYNEKRNTRKKEDPKYRLLCNHRNYVYKCITKFQNKRGSSISYLGCDLNMFKQWIEYQFTSEMNWDNYGKVWTIDHCLPLSSFDLSIQSHQQIAFNWKNLSPITDNFKKSSKLRLYEYFNLIISAHRFIQYHKLGSQEYQGINKSLYWLREKLGYGKKLQDEGKNILPEMGNPQPSS